MMNNPIIILLTALFLFSCGGNRNRANAQSKTPVEKNGRLRVEGLKLVNEQGENIQLKGVSSHGLYWFKDCFDASAIDHLSKNWRVDIIRLALYTGNYSKDPEGSLKLIDALVDEAEKRGIYCLIDWHVLMPGDPNAQIDDAKIFWQYMSKKHAAKKNVLYEICNEPNGVPWEAVKTYCSIIIPLIRANDPEAVIIVGTPDWSANLKAAADDPLPYPNLMYSFHFYAKSHKNRPAFLSAIARIPVFVTEWGTTSHTGDNGLDLVSSAEWLKILAGDNPQKLKISWINWSFSDKDEDSAILLPGSGKRQDWTRLTESGAWVKQQFGN